MGRYCSFFLWLLTSFAVVVSASAEVPAEVTDLWISPSTVLEHETFVISCTVEGDPEPTVAISNTYTGVVVYINVTSGTVNVTVNAEWFDSVAWRCAASNVLTNGTRYVASTNATVTVHFSPRPDHAQEYNVTAGIGEFAPLLMAYIANPAPNVTWTHDGNVIPETTTGGVAPFGFSMLNVSDIEVWDFLSVYEITMDNGVGPSYTATYRIIPHVPAEVTDLWISPSTVLEHETFVISCTVEGDPEPTVAISNTYTGVVVYINVTSGTVNVTVNAEWFDSVAWRCAASNVLTNGTRYVASTNATVTVHFSPRPDHAQEYNVTAGIGEFAPLLMAYIANPAPNVTWTHDGNVIPETTTVGVAPFGFSMLNVSDIEVWDFLSVYEITMDNGVGPSYTATYRIIPHGSSPEPESSDTNVAIIVGPAVGGACLLVLVLAILFYYRHRRRVSYIMK